MSWSWDEYFEDICDTVANNSKCFSRKIGAVIVKDKSIISTGYNGPPRGIPHCNERYQKDSQILSLLKQVGITNDDFNWNQCPRKTLGCKSGEMVDICIAGHAERNSLINAARHGISTKGCTMYMNCEIPCTPCLIEIINAGIERIVVKDFKLYDKQSEYILKHSDLEVKKLNEGKWYRP